MGDSVGKIKFRVGLDGKDQFRKEVSDLTNVVNVDLKSAFAGLAGMIAAAFSVKVVLGFLEASRGALKYTIEQQTKLESIMRSRMNATNEEIDAIRELNSELQKTGLIEDDIAASGAAQLARYTQSAETLKNLIPAMQNLAVANGGFNTGEGEVTNAASVLGKALSTGNTALLARQGIVFSDAEEAAFKIANEFERSEMLTRKIEATFGDINSMLGNNVYGKTVQIKNAWGDLQENVGRMLDAILYPMYDIVLNIVNALVDATGRIADMAEQFFGIESTQNRTVGSIGAMNEGLEETAAISEKIQKTAFGFDNLNKLQGSALAGGAGSAASLQALKNEKGAIEETSKEASLLQQILEKIFENKHIKNGAARLSEATTNLKNAIKDTALVAKDIVTSKESMMFASDLADIGLGVAGATMQAGAMGMNIGALGIDLTVLPFLESVRDNLDKIYGVWKGFKETLIDPTIDGINNFLNNTNIKLDAFINEKVPGLRQVIKEGWDTFFGAISTIWEKVLEPLFSSIGDHIDRLFADGGVLDESVSRILECFGIIIENAGWLFDGIAVLSAAFFGAEGIKFGEFIDGLIGVLEYAFIFTKGAFEMLAGLFEVITGVITLDFEKVVHGFVLMIQGFVDAFVNSLITPIINKIQDFVNWAINALNKIPGVSLDKATFANNWGSGIDVMTPMLNGFGIEDTSKSYNPQYRATALNRTQNQNTSGKFEITNVIQLDGKTVATTTNNINNRNKSTFGNSTFQNMNIGFAN